jgi:PilZ domain
MTATTMRRQILSFLGTLPVRELLRFREVLNKIIEGKLQKDLGRRKHQRARVKISATANIEREAEFFQKAHKVTILDVSTNGLLFSTAAPVINNDIMSVTFRSPGTGEQKNIDCQAVRIKETNQHSYWEYQVGAKAVDQKTVHAYREMLKNRGRF